MDPAILLKRWRYALPLAALALAAACSDGKSPVIPPEVPDQPVAAAAEGVGSIRIEKLTQGTAGGPFSFARSFGENFGLTTPASDVVVGMTFSDVPAGTHTVQELLVAFVGWDFIGITELDAVGGATCVEGVNRTATITLPPGGSVTCRFTNRRRATVTVAKRENGSLPISAELAAAIEFQIRSEASTGASGTTVASSAGGGLNPATGVVAFPTCLVGGALCRQAAGNAIIFIDTYPGTNPFQLCEAGLPPGLKSTLHAVTTPDGAVCRPFDLAAGASGSPAGVPNPIDNLQLPGGPPRGTGYWSTWNSCATSSGHQFDKALAAGMAEWTMDGSLAHALPLGGISAVADPSNGTNSTSVCDAVNIISRRSRDGTNRANDGAYALAAQLLAAKLNVQAGAVSCPAAATAIADGQALLAAASFFGTGAYLPPGSPGRAAALALAGILDSYNEGSLCP